MRFAALARFASASRAAYPVRLSLFEKFGEFGQLGANAFDKFGNALQEKRGSCFGGL